jgi:uncharacterized membrane protein required for colicin V production
MVDHLIKIINWIDVMMFFLFLRVIFVGVQTGIISELFKILGTIAAVFITLHCYSWLAAWLALKINYPWKYYDLVAATLLAGIVVFVFKLIRDGLVLLFKAETTHQGFDKYSAGVVGIGRGILICSLMMFLLLLLYNGAMTRTIFRSYSYKIAGHAAVGTYGFLYNNIVGKLSSGGHYNAAAVKVVSPLGR